MYRLLVGDIALQRGEPALAARAYYDVARETRDPKFARRATEIALAARQRTLALDSATLWVELDSNGRPRQAGRRRTQRRQRRSRRGPQGGPRTGAGRGGNGRAAIGRAFLELNRALASEPDKAATLKLVQALAQPYPNNAEANFAVALAAFNTGLTDFESATAALQGDRSRAGAEAGVGAGDAAQGRDPRQAVAGSGRRLP
jgi:hypothetical protein